MKLTFRLSFIALTLTGLLACTQLAPVDFTQNQVRQLGVKNLQVPSTTSIASGQPTREQLSTLANQGVKHVINLRPDSELTWREKDVVEALGMQYHSIPVAGKPGLTLANAQALDSLMEQLQGEPVLLHCSSSNRVGGLIALAENHIRGASIEASIVKGKAWGLTRLEPFVRAKLKTQ